MSKVDTALQKLQQAVAGDAVVPSKTQCVKALKSCNNNVPQAVIFLRERHGVANGGGVTSLKTAGPLAVRPDSFSVEIDDDDMEPLVPKKITTRLCDKAEKKRMHPCVAQYGACRYGKFCALKQAPADACINYLQGSCAFGAMCKNRHNFEGAAALRELLMGVVQEDEFVIPHPSGDGRLIYMENNEVVWVSEPVQGTGSLAPEPADFNAEKTTVPSYSDPARDAAQQQQPQQPAAAVPFTPLATPYRDRVIASTSGSVKIISNQPSSQKPSAATVAKDSSTALHPCVVQMGSCRFGSACNHAQLPGNTCVHWLNARCKFTGDQCRFQHQIVSKPSPISAPAADSAPSVGSSLWSIKRVDAPPAQPMHPRQAMDASPLIPATKNSPTAASSSTTPAAGEESAAFAALTRVFPDVSPMILLHAIRLTGNDRTKVAEFVLNCNSRTPAVIESSLLEIPEVRSQLDRLAKDQAQQHHSIVLLTFCSLFPAMEPAALANLLEQCHGDIGTATAIAACSHDNVLGQQQDNPWARTLQSGDKSLTATMSPADVLKLSKLESMFVDCDKPSVEACFRACKRDLQLSIQQMNRILAEEKNIVLDDQDIEGRRQDAEARLRSSLDDERKRVFENPSSSSTTSGGGGGGGGGSGEASSSSYSAAPSNPRSISTTDAYKIACDESNENQDWVRVREEAYLVGSARARLVSALVEAYGRQDHRVAKTLAYKCKQLKVEYQRLNLLAMLALERERNMTGCPSVIDLHGFHVDEAIDVLDRRIDAARAQRLWKIRIVVGRGTHSRNGRSVLFPAVMDYVQQRENASSATMKITSVKPAEVVVTLL